MGTPLDELRRPHPDQARIDAGAAALLRRCVCRDRNCFVPHDECQCGCPIPHRFDLDETGVRNFLNADGEADDTSPGGHEL